MRTLLITPAVLLGILLGGVSSAPAQEKPGQEKPAQEKQSEFSFPPDLGGALIQKTLTPRVPLAAIAEKTTHPRPKPTPESIANPTGLLPTPVEIIRLAPLQPRGVPAPRIALVERPLSEPLPPATLPSSVVLATPAKTRTERPNPAQAPELPYLAAFVPERAPLEDPTRETSLQAVLTAPIPVRQNPLPFARQSIPDPFENRRTVQFTHPGEEPGQPLNGTPRVP